MAVLVDLQSLVAHGGEYVAWEACHATDEPGDDQPALYHDHHPLRLALQYLYPGPEYRGDFLSEKYSTRIK